jgi:hypothetical protein
LFTVLFLYASVKCGQGLNASKLIKNELKILR